MKDFFDRYFLMDAADYLGEAYHFPIVVLLFCMTVGLIVASIAIYRQKRIEYVMAKQLIRHGADSRENAKTVAELGLDGNRAICRALRRNAKIGHFIARVGEVVYSYEDYVALQKAKKLPKDVVDLTEERFFIAPDAKDRAVAIYERATVSISQPIFAIVLLVAVFFALTFSMPSILTWIASLLPSA